MAHFDLKKQLYFHASFAVLVFAINFIILDFYNYYRINVNQGLRVYPCSMLSTYSSVRLHFHLASSSHGLISPYVLTHFFSILFLILV